MKGFIIWAAVFILIIILIPVSAVLIKKFYKKSMKKLARSDYESAAIKKARKLKHDDPVISCDYCGAEINTALLKKCAQCGAPYDEDKEWKTHLVDDENSSEYGSDKYLDAQKKNADENAENANKTARRGMIIIGAVILVIVAVVIILGYFL